MNLENQITRNIKKKFTNKVDGLFTQNSDRLSLIF